MSSAVERADSMFGSWRKLPGAQPSHAPEHHLTAQALKGDVSEFAGWVRGQGEARTESSLLHARTLINDSCSLVPISLLN